MSFASDNQSQPQLLREVSEDDDAMLDAVVCSIIDDDKTKLNCSEEEVDIQLTIKQDLQEELDMELNEDEPELENHNLNNDFNHYIDENGQCSRSKSSASESSASSSNGTKKPLEYETDPSILARRQKDIDYGKNTIGYDKYIQQIPKYRRTKDHPRTPPMYLKYSRRGWDGMVKLWRKQLHYWDPLNESKKDDKTNSS